ncbi:MAG TPA: BatD family protein [Mucilaginibacter sp.]|jgi:hypothetical protein
MVKRGILLVLLMCFAFAIKAQVDCFAQTQLDRRSVYAQQPFKVTFTVLTATWYTAPLEFDNLQIPNAFILPFDRTMPGMFTIKGKQYAGLQFYFIVFPYKEGHYTLPAINIVATTPPVGDSKAKKVNIKTQPLSYIVKPVPKSFAGANWFVAKDAVINQIWDKPLNKLKVGDVINSTISINARGTLPQFIPELPTDSLDWAGVYPGHTTLADTRDDYDANGRSTQTVTYLLEKEGNFTLPVSTIEWFNPNNSRFYKRHTPVRKIHVAANPNLGILTTLKDSLKAKQPVKATINTKHGPYLVFGIPWYYFALYSVAAICIIYVIVRVLINIGKWLYGRYKSYLVSEQYWFGKFKRSSLAYPALLKSLYAWWDRLPVQKAASIQKDVHNRNEDEIGKQLASYYKSQYAGGDPGNIDVGTELKKNIKKYRGELINNNELKANEHVAINQLEWKE